MPDDIREELRGLRADVRDLGREVTRLAGLVEDLVRHRAVPSAPPLEPAAPTDRAVPADPHVPDAHATGRYLERLRAGGNRR